MSNMLTARVQIVGVRPLFWHKFGPDALPLEKREKSGIPGNDPDEWRRTVLVTKEGRLFVLGTYVFGTLREAAKFTSKKRGNYRADVAATLQVLTDRILIDRWFPGYPNGADIDIKTVEVPSEDPEAPVYLDVRGVVNPSTRGRNIRYRVATSSGWTAEFELSWDKTIVPRDILNAIAIDAGKLVGIGNGRAIGMGRFSIASFEVNE